MRHIKVSLYTRESGSRRYVKVKRGRDYPSTTTWVLRYGSTWETLKVSSLAAATSERIQRELDLLRGWRPTAKPRAENGPNVKMLDAAMDEYLAEIEAGRKPKTFRAYKVSLRYFYECVGNKPLKDINRGDLLDFPVFLRDEKQQADRSTYNKFENVMTFLKHYDITGINLQFCRLMINYDLPWNPTRLEQRLGRIHRIGQERDVHAFNFVASESEEGQPIIEGRILERLLQKMEQMRNALADRVFDVIGEVLSLNDVNLPEILREAANDPRRLDEYLDQIERVDPARLLQYEQATGIALARANVDFSGFQTKNAEAEERRLMPRYVEQHFLNAAREVGLKVETRADGLYRVEHVLADLRSDRLTSLRRLGKPETSYRKVTFHKEHLEMDQHIDAVLIGPGHPLYAAVDERLNEMLAPLTAGVGVFVDTNSEVPYKLHFFEMGIKGQNTKGETQTLLGELVAVREELTNGEERFTVVPADVLLDLPAHPAAPENLEPEDATPAADFLKSTHQTERRAECQQERQRFVQVCRDYLQQSFDARVRAAQDRVMNLRAREIRDPDVAIARQRAENDLADLTRTRVERLAGLQRLTLAKHGPVRHVATALVLGSTRSVEEQIGSALDDLDPEIRRKCEIAAEDVVIAYETTRGFECERVGHLKIGFDVRSIGPADPQTGYRDPVTGIRRIEVKGRRRGQPVRLTTNEWYKATQLGDSYWLYVVWNPLNSPDREPVMIQNPVKYLDHAKREIIAARYYDIPAEAIEGAAQKQKGLPL